MSNTTTQHKSDSSSASPVRPAYIHIGRDATGAVHCWHALTNTVHVIYDGRRRQRIPLDAVAEFEDIDHYAVVIGDRRGWCDLNYGLDAVFASLEGL
jgi:hypothetical protein